MVGIVFLVAPCTYLYKNISQLVTDRIGQTENTLKESIEHQKQEIVQLKTEIAWINDLFKKMESKLEEIKKKSNDFQTKSETVKIKEDISTMVKRLEDTGKRMDDLKANTQTRDIKERLDKLENIAHIMEVLLPKLKNPNKMV